MAVGLVAVFKSHNNGPTVYVSNLYSLHSWIGLGVMLLYIVQFVSAVCAFGPTSSVWSTFRSLFRIGSTTAAATTTTTTPTVMPVALSPSFRAKLLLVHRYLGPTIYVGVMVTMLLGIQEKEGFITCSYSVTTPDTNPISNFDRIPVACRQSHLLGILVLLTGVTTVFALSGI
jgi:cytochrome b-561